MAKFLKKGEGWRLGWNPNGEKYRGLIGGEDWAMELTAGEWEDFHRLLKQLSATMGVMAGELMPGERIACEAESDLIWMEAEGFPNGYGLRVIINNDRRCEGYWPADVVPRLIETIENSQEF